MPSFLERLAVARQSVSVPFRRVWRWWVEQNLWGRFIDWMIPEIISWPTPSQAVILVAFFMVVMAFRVLQRLAEASASAAISILSIGVYKLSYKLLYASLRLYTLSVKLAETAHGLRLPVVRDEE